MYIAVLAGVALVGCTKNERTSELIDSQKEITFTSPILSSATKTPVSGEMDNPYSTSEKFNVYAVWHNGDFSGSWTDHSLYMDDVQTDYSSTLDGWHATPSYYWPKNGKLTFAAYSPSEIGGTSHAYGSTGLSITGYEVPTDAANQYDVMYSERAYNNISSTGTDTYYKGVDIKFHHALSSIQFGIKTLADYSSSVTIKLRKITVYGVYSKGDFTEGITNEVAYANTPAWSNPANVVAEANAYVYYSDELIVSDTETLLNGVTGQTDLILLPQTLPDTGYITIEYGIDPVGGTTPEIAQKHTVQINSLSATEWKPGKRYTYHITIGLDEIYFAPEVLDWDEKSVTIPQI
ncbi:MAG: fimbrillin family protein [Candidatus Cryptobacteroides sp.]